ncbi:putative oxidoreductase [Lachnellula suecica]|uniref:Putative oxidoreductase n=1 Tax=Lachnellula suecica TaxID=602035 RepID=A0A8T9BS02_9HELO|nr:putative oxidoreductase [Lachnellula suecica]
MPNILIIGATRGLGASLANLYASTPSNKVYGTTRSAHAPKHHSSAITWVPHIDLSREGVGEALVKGLQGVKVEGGFEVVVITAGYFATEDFEEGPKWEEEVRMYTTSSIAPPFLIHALTTSSLLPRGSKVLLVSSESGSITLRHAKEGGGNYGHHASKTALNMVGKLLSLDLKERGVCVSVVHPGFMRTEMTKGVGFDKFWDDGGAVTPDEAAKSLVEWVEKLDMSKSGEYWAPRGPRDIGTAEVTIGKNLPTPLQLPW